jgi:hypothetical protein
MICSLVFEDSPFSAQIESLRDFWSEELVERIRSLRHDVVFHNLGTTVDANGTHKIRVGLGLGTSFERLRAAVLAGKAADLH